MSQPFRQSLESKIDGLTASVDALDGKVDRLDRTLRGNGQAGLLTKSALMEARVTAIEDFVEEMQRFRRWLTLGVLSLFGTLIWQVVQTVLQKP